MRNWVGMVPGWWIFCFLLTVGSAAAEETTRAGAILQIEVHDTLQPERATVFARTVEQASRQGYAAILVNLSTPGGLSESADLMVQAMDRSQVPVIVWAGAPQTRVSGAGLRLLVAADIALMNSHVFLTPLWTDRGHGYSLQRRAAGSQQLLASLTADAARHGRTPYNLEEVSSGTHWYPASEALENHLVDGVADKVPDVLRLIHGRVVQRQGRAIALNVARAAVETARIKPQEALLLTLMNPDLCVLLLTLGLLLVYLEINTPGAVVPGAAGVLLVLLAAYALHLLPLRAGGVVLCLLAGLMLLLEARFRAHGLLASGGVLTLVIGLGTLVDGPIPQLQVEWGTAVGAGLGFGGVTAALILLGLEARRAKIKTGADAMLGWLAVAHTALAPDGQILVRGELWKARLTSNDSFVAAGERVKVLRADGTHLEVTAVPLVDTA